MAEELLTSQNPSNTRALLIFTTYLTTNTLITLLLITTVVKAYRTLTTKNHKPRQLHLRLITFTTLAILSLAVTWHYMLSFFTLSYTSWAAEHNVALPSTMPWNDIMRWQQQLQLGAWLKDVQLFRDAWETVVETSPRTVWSLPIFFVTAAWSFYIAREASRRKIGYAFAFMVLGQLVAISFAMNLFYLAVIVHADAEFQESSDGSALHDAKTIKVGEKPQLGRIDRSKTSWSFKFLDTLLLPLTFSSIAFSAMSAGKKEFLKILTIPHVLLLLPPLLYHTLPRSDREGLSRTDVDVFYRAKFQAVLLFGVLFEIVTLWLAFNSPKSSGLHLHRHSNVHTYPWIEEVGQETQFQVLWRSLFDHPAVSSVGWDSILCTISFLTWKMTSP